MPASRSFSTAAATLCANALAAWDSCSACMTSCSCFAVAPVYMPCHHWSSQFLDYSAKQTAASCSSSYHATRQAAAGYRADQCPSFPACWISWPGPLLAACSQLAPGKTHMLCAVWHHAAVRLSLTAPPSECCLCGSKDSDLAQGRLQITPQQPCAGVQLCDLPLSSNERL